MLSRCPNGDKLDQAIIVSAEDRSCGICLDWPMEPEHDFRHHTHVELPGLDGEVYDVITDQYILWTMGDGDAWKLGLEAAILYLQANDYPIVAVRRIRLTGDRHEEDLCSSPGALDDWMGSV